MHLMQPAPICLALRRSPRCVSLAPDAAMPADGGPAGLADRSNALHSHLAPFARCEICENEWQTLRSASRAATDIAHNEHSECNDSEHFSFFFLPVAVRAPQRLGIHLIHLIKYANKYFVFHVFFPFISSLFRRADNA